ncbi:MULTISPECIES: transaldolase [unclassified Campylobacter]|uniref:transaldolase n=1 Tax=unclassified Campylobacter TaxID=2593542 RepID=UPI001237DFB1|nr:MULTISPECIES: transaldolase [unclassified Campylobacter]KAA6227236.1 transaldolase [Campylobacter sp. LR286c]KAA6227890.1 transaldolase [Campylobacter sp. LR185c]KAA6228299.1 transaldolase [Campylobacter sp. LR196d]KAA6229300.1 transaldolase [Campylobacter sp. LR291e]KAA6231106.1 transaldolase [Campylobacter sp. LR264d]
MSKFSLWCDFIEHSFLDNEFLNLLNRGINGATSNPAIFKQAILNSSIYKDKIAKSKVKKAKELYEELAIADIKKAADKLAYKFFQNDDGFISLEIDPRLHDNTSLSLAEAKRLYSVIAKDNVMMKIPATKNSYEVMYELMKIGINVNATLIFSTKQCQECFDALNLGLKEFRKQNPRLRAPQGVISIFVSRFDRLLKNDKIGILNANLAYNLIERNKESNIRALFASTGVKGDDLAKDYYIKELLFDNAINTAPLESIHAFKGEFNFKKPLYNDELYKELNLLISPDKKEEVDKFLLDDGLNQFCLAFEDILKALW